MDQAGLSWDLVRDLQQLLDYQFMRNAFEAGTIVGVLSGVVGYFMVLRGQSFAGHTLSQVGFPGAAGAALLGLPPLYGLVAFCTGSALAIGSLGGSQEGSGRLANAGIASILVASLALGLVFARLYHGFVDATYSFLFGTFLGISQSQVYVLLLIAVFALAVVCLIGRPLLFASIEPEVAQGRGVPVQWLSYGFLVLLGLAVASVSLITGTLLVFALLVTPAATARELTARPLAGMCLAVLLAVLVTWLGLAMAYYSVYPLGFFVTSLSFAAYLLARAVRWLADRAGSTPDATALLPVVRP